MPIALSEDEEKPQTNLSEDELKPQQKTEILGTADTSGEIAGELDKVADAVSYNLMLDKVAKAVSYKLML